MDAVGLWRTRDKPLLRHIPGWEKFELNVRADRAGARPDAGVVIFDGAYFEDGGDMLEVSGIRHFLIRAEAETRCISISAARICERRRRGLSDPG